MSLATELIREQMSDTQTVDEHEYDLIYELGRRLIYLTEYDRYIAHARGWPDLQKFWRGVRDHERQLVSDLKRLISEQVQSHSS